MAMPPGAYSSKQGMKERVPSGYKQYALNNYTPEQQQLFKEGFAHVSPDSYTGRLAAGDQSIFNEIEAPAHKQFSEVLGGLGSRFSGMGTGGTRSSGFRNTANQASQDFAMQLQSQRQGLQRQAILDLMGMSETLLNRRPQEKDLVEKQQKQPSGWGGIAGAGLGAAGGFFLGGPAGALQGAQLGYGVGSSF